MQRFGLSSRLAAIGRVNALMVFKNVCDSLSAIAPNWAFSMLTLDLIQDHPVHIPCGQRLACSSRASGGAPRLNAIQISVRC